MRRTAENAAREATRRRLEVERCQDEQEEPFIYMAYHHPQATAHFVEVSMLFGIVSGGVVSTAVAAFLALEWSSCAECDRPLRWWLLVHLGLQSVQTVARAIIYASLRERSARDMGDEARITVLAKTLVWRTSHRLSLYTFAWLVLGVVWIINTRECKGHFGLLPITYVVVLQSTLRVACVLAFFRRLFPTAPAQEEQPKLAPAEDHQIAALPLVPFCERKMLDGPDLDYKDDADDEQSSDTSCAVCLSEYADGDLLRCLPCGHKFHQCCCDMWLQRNKRCPLCIRPIDEVAHRDLISWCCRRMKVH